MRGVPGAVEGEAGGVSETPIWFDDVHTHAAAGVYLLTPDRRLILQLRDDIAGIDNPGRITAFAGGAHRHETPIACALRELNEETGLAAKAEALEFVGGVSRTNLKGKPIACVFYLLTDVDPAALSVTEGTQIVLTFDQAAADPRLTETTRRFAAQIAANLPPPG